MFGRRARRALPQARVALTAAAAASSGPLTLSAVNCDDGLASVLPESQRFRDGLPRACRDPRNGRFVNPWLNSATGEDVCEKSFAGACRGIWELWVGIDRQAQNVPREFGAELKVNWARVRRARSDTNSPPIAVWLGHASVLVVCHGKLVLFDPVFSERCSPFSFAGPARHARCPVDLCKENSWPSDLAPDLIAVSHAHYDHLDEASVLMLRQRFPQSRWAAPLGLRSWFSDKVGIDLDAEMDWWDKSEGLLGDDLSLVCLPAQHWSNRWPWDRNETLWCGYGVAHKEKPTKMEVFFAGDTGYCSVYKLLGTKYDIRLALIPIGAYEPNWFLAPQHCNPKEAVQIVKELNADAALAIHWGTFPLTVESPMQQLSDLLCARGDDARLQAVRIGGIVSADLGGSDADLASMYFQHEQRAE